MKKWNDHYILGVDHGYGNIKTANHCFKNGLIVSDTEPLFTSELLIYEGRYYIVGEGHKEFIPDKGKDEDYYILTLAAIAMEYRAGKKQETDAAAASEEVAEQ